MYVSMYIYYISAVKHILEIFLLHMQYTILKNKLSHKMLYTNANEINLFQETVLKDDR